MRINHNIAAMNTYRQLGQANQAQSNSMEKLSSGLRINNASDDAAGLAISEKMRGQIRGLDQATTNAQDANSMIQTAEGALNETHSILQRMRELATQASNDTNTETDRGEIQKEMNQLTSEINRVGNTTEFNTQKLLDGGNKKLDVTTTTTGDSGTSTAGVYTFDLDASSLEDGQKLTIDSSEYTYQSDGSGDFKDAASLKTAVDGDGKFTIAESSGTFTLTQAGGEESATGPEVNIAPKADGFTASFQVGANEGQSMSIEIEDMRASALGLTGEADTGNFTTNNTVTDGTDNTTTEAALDVSTHENASAAITKVNDAIEQVSAQRSNLGAYQNRLDHTINNLGTSSENLTAAESRIRDVDMAKEMMNQTKESILSQASQAMLAKANQQPQGVLQLLR